MLLKTCTVGIAFQMKPNFGVKETKFTESEASPLLIKRSSTERYE